MIRRIPASPIAAVLISVALLGSANIPDELDPQDFHPATPSAAPSAAPAAETIPALDAKSVPAAVEPSSPVPQASTGALSAATTDVPATSPGSPEILRPTRSLPLIDVTPLPGPSGHAGTATERDIRSIPSAESMTSPSPAVATPVANAPAASATQAAATPKPSVTQTASASATSSPSPSATAEISAKPTTVPAAVASGEPQPAAVTPPPTAAATPVPTPTPIPARTPVPAPHVSAALEDPVSETFWGATVTDRYRYLEHLDDTRTKAFFETQGDAAAQYLRALNPARDRLFDRIRELDRSSVSVGSVTRVYNTYFYERQDPTDETAALFMRTADGRSPKLLVDPSREKRGKTHFTLDWMVPAPNSRYVAFGLSSGGSEASTLHVVDTTSGKRLHDAIDRTRFGASGWLPDSHSIIYTRLPKTNAKTPVTDRERFLRSYIHRIGTDVAKDRAIFGWKVDAKVPFGPDDVPSVSIAPGSKYVTAVIGHGVQNELTIYAAPYAELAAGKSIAWKKIVDVGDGVTSFDIRGAELYALSHKDASNYRVRRTALNGSTALRDIVKPGRAVIQQIGIARDGLYLRTLDGGIGRIAKIPFGAKNISADEKYIALPYDGSITSIVTDPRVAGVTFGLTGWTHSLLWYRTDGNTKIADTALKPISPIDSSAYTSKEVLARSNDGTEIPLSIIMKKDTVLDGTHPTYLQGYGAYGQTLSPYFSTTRIAWLERGGVYAVAHVRGGGEYGENWHRAGMRAKKKRSIDDFIACAKYLIAEKYTSPRYLGAEGTSAGGIVVGGAITHAPQLFAGVLDVVGVSNALRSEFSENGPGNIPEFGTVKIREEFFTLFDVDAVAQVKNGTAYPGVMLITGLNDPRVPSWELGKFAARLQKATTSGKPIILRIDKDAGHGFLAASRTQSEELLTDEYAFLLEQMGLL